MNLSVVASILVMNFIAIETIFGAPDCIVQPSCKDLGPSDNYVCKGTGFNIRCFCCSPSKLERIFGWFWASSMTDETCACSRHRDELEKTTGRKDISLHCMDNGSYEKLQCDNGMCWCVEPESGKPTERIYPASMMRHLPCYTAKPSDLRQRYERECESATLARITVLRKLEAHGTKGSHIEMPRCDYDGSYNAKKYVKRVVHCSWKDGKQIQGYVADVANFNLVDCNCARDSVIYEEENTEFDLMCADNGNYMTNQISNGMPFCVDADGYATSQLGDIGEVFDCAACA